MKQITTALLAGALALASGVAFAQVGIGANTGTSGGVAVGTGSGTTGGSTQLNSATGTNVKAGGTSANVGVDASGNTRLKKKNSQTTGSGAAGANNGIKTGVKTGVKVK